MIYHAPVKDMMFLINEWIGLDRINGLPGFDHVDEETLEFILEEAGRFCAGELLPINRQGDETGAQFEDGQVRTPPGFREAFRKYRENGWTGIAADPDHGGQGLPKLVQFQVDEMMSACNPSFKLYAELTTGAYHLMNHAAPDQLKAVCLPKMVAGEWSGTMCLTEPHAGTDLGLLTTRATPDGDGMYRVNGTKIFITSGDHDLTENILHMVLARIDGAPAGAKGISLFLVPKYSFDSDGIVGERNGVVTGSIEHKMGIKGSATCVLNFDDARGYLLGTEHRGLSAMFKMMNIERITVGIQGLGFAEVAYQNALAYAKERVQSKAPPPRPDPERAADPIILQPDIQRKLLTIRAQVEGGRALSVFTGFHADLSERSPDAETREQASGVVALLTPIVKSYLSDLGVSSALEAQQVFGGHGYIREHGMEQLVRDARIAPIYEGTNEVQAVDLVMRKLHLAEGRVVADFFDQLEQSLEPHAADNDIVADALAALGSLRVSTALMQARCKDSVAAAAAAATPFQRMFALVVVACLWARIIVAIDGRDDAFCETKRKLARFYMHNVLPEAVSLAQVVDTGVASINAFDWPDD